MSNASAPDNGLARSACLLKLHSEFSWSQCRQQGRLREIKLPSTVDDYAYILHEDYQACINTAFQNEQASRSYSYRCGSMNVYPDH